MRHNRVRAPEGVRAFTLIELMIVLVTITALIALLMPALNAIRDAAGKAATRMQLEAITQAIQSYRVQMGGELPGYLSETELVANSDRFTGNENLVLSLMGAAAGPGAVTTWSVGSATIDLDAVGAGPLIQMADQQRKKGAFLGPKAGQLFAIPGTTGPQNPMPELLDSTTGLPILYLRADRAGALRPVGDGGGGFFDRRSIADYVDSIDLAGYDGDLWPQGPQSGLSGAAGSNNLAWMLTSPKLSSVVNGVSGSANNDLLDVPAGEFALIAPGPDRVYVSLTGPIDSYDRLGKLDDVWVTGN